MNAGLPACLVIAGGGTGGHLMPGLAVAHELRARGVGRIIFAGTERGLETRLVPAAGFELVTVEVGGLKNVGWRRQAETLASLPRAVLQSKQLLESSRAAAVLGIGGYASGPMLAAARWRRVPLVLLEINTRPGLANRLAGGWARSTAVAFAEAAPYFPRSVLTGLPVRAEFLAPAPPAAAAADAPLRLLSFGGGQGARAINYAVLGLAALWGDSPAPREILHQTGAREWDAMREAYARLPGGCQAEDGGLHYRRGGLDLRAVPFIERMAEAMQRAEIVVCRSGAGTLAELAALGRPAVLIPFPAAADQHQLHNARALAQAGAAQILPQDQLTPQALETQLLELHAHPERRTAMSAVLRSLAHPDATRRIADLVLAAARPQ